MTHIIENRFDDGECVCVCVTNFYYELELPQGFELWCTICTYPFAAENLLSASPLNKCFPS